MKNNLVFKIGDKVHILAVNNPDGSARYVGADGTVVQVTQDGPTYVIEVSNPPELAGQSVLATEISLLD